MLRFFFQVSLGPLQQSGSATILLVAITPSPSSSLFASPSLKRCFFTLLSVNGDESLCHTPGFVLQALPLQA